MKRNLKHIILCILILIIAVSIGISTLSPPKVYNGSDSTRFSAVNAANYLKVIAKEPHSIVDIQAHEEVYQYLYDELEIMGLNPQTYEYNVAKKSDTFPGYRIKNLYAHLDGKSEDSILLVAHYDSAYEWDYSRKAPMKGVSYGAADAGYGIITILETVRAIKALETPLENNIKILFTDSEEADLDGAVNAIEQNPELFKNVKLVINVEARGIKGPAIMFETSNNNSSIINYFNKNAKTPFSFSFVTDIYRNMPNGSDLSVFLEKGFNGMNFAVVDNLDYYHTEKDSYEYINLGSIQHYGEQIFSVVRNFSLTPKEDLPDFKSDTNKVFFSVPLGNMINYSEDFAIILLVTGIVSIIVYISIFSKNQCLKIWKTVLITVVISLIAAICSLIATGVPYLLSKVHGVKFNLIYLPHIPNANIFYVCMIAITVIILVYICSKIVSNSYSKVELLLAGIVFNIIFAALTTRFSIGASYIFIIPVILTVITAFINYFSKNIIVRYIVFTILTVTVSVFYIPVLYLLNSALTIGAVGISVGLTFISGALIIPAFLNLIDE